MLPQRSKWVDSSAWTKYCEIIKPDGMEKWVERAEVLTARTEMIGVP